MSEPDHIPEAESGLVITKDELAISRNLFQQIRSGLLPYLTVAVGVIGCGAAQEAQKPDDARTFQQLMENNVKGSVEKLTDSTLNKFALSLLERGDVSTFNYLRTQHPEWKPVFRGAKLQIRYLMNAQLTDADFSQANLYGTDFSGAVLVRAKFNGAKLHNTHFNDNADLTNAEFIGTMMEQPTFLTANLKDAKFINSTLISANFAGADLTGAFIDQCKMAEARFVGGAKLDRVTIIASDLSNADLSRSSTRNAHFTNVTFVGGHFKHAELFSTVINGGDYSHADFTSAGMENIDIFAGNFTSAQFVHAQLPFGKFGHRAILKSANFSDANLQHAAFKGMKLKGIPPIEMNDSVFDRADLSSATVQHANMNGSRFYKSVFYYAIFSDVTLCGADFAGADLTDATFEDVKVDGIDESGNIKGKKPRDLTPEQVGAMRKKPTLPVSPSDGK